MAERLSKAHGPSAPDGHLSTGDMAAVVGGGKRGGIDVGLDSGLAPD